MKKLLCLILILLIGSTGLSAESSVLNFRIFLSGKLIGMHSYTIKKNSDHNLLKSKADMKGAALGFINFHYNHTSSEKWSNGCLDRMDSATDENGQFYKVTGRKTTSAFEINSGKKTKIINSGCVRSFVYWDLSLLQSDYLLNPQTGDFTKVQLVKEGKERIKAGDKTYDAQKYILKNKDADIELWYDQSGRWLSLQSKTWIGQTIRYERIQ